MISKHLNTILTVITLCLTGFSNTVYSKELCLNGTENQVFLSGDLLYYYEDSAGRESINDILKKEQKQDFFQPIPFANSFFVKNPATNYWFKVKIKNNSLSNQHYLLESFNYRIDSIVFYETNAKEILNSESVGVTFKFGKRTIKHKNLIYSFWLDSGKEKIVYIKIKNRYKTPVEFVLRKSEYFTSYAISEYFFLGLFYGSILIIALLNILAGIYMKSIAHYYYVFYVFFVGLFFLSQDGLGFQYLWPNLQFLNDYSYMLSLFFMNTFLLLYTGAFLNLKTHYPFYLKIFYAFIGIRFAILIVTLLYFPNIGHLLYIDILPYFLAYYCAYLSYRSDYPLSKYFLIGFTILLLGFLYNFLRFLGLIESTVFSFYLINICFLLEMIVFYFALAERIRYYKQHKEISVELKRIIDDKENLIEQFTYKTSHDLSGPVKTILGITNLAIDSKDSKELPSYINLIQTTALKLDDILKAIMEINLLRAYETEKSELDINILKEKIIASPKIKIYSSNITFNIIPEHKGFIKIDHYILYSLIYNLLLYQLLCIQHKGEKSICIDIYIDKKTLKIHSSNNGELIPEKYHHKIINIFFRLSNNDHDLGTCMHIVKLCTDKLNGEIHIFNKTSTSFTVTIPL